MAISKETRLLKMLKQDKTKYCWLDGKIAGEPQDSIKDAIADYVDNEYNYGDSDDYMRSVKKEHIDELSNALSKVFQAWEKSTDTKIVHL